MAEHVSIPIVTDFSVNLRGVIGALIIPQGLSYKMGEQVAVGLGFSLAAEAAWDCDGYKLDAVAIKPVPVARLEASPASVSTCQVNAELLACLRLLEPFLTTEAEAEGYASQNDGRMSAYDTVSMRARRAIAEASGVAQCGT